MIATNGKPDEREMLERRAFHFVLGAVAVLLALAVVLTLTLMSAL